MRIFPGLRLLRLLAIGAPLWMLAALVPGGWLPGLAWDLVLLGLCGYELARPLRPIQAERRLTRLSLLEDAWVELDLRNPNPVGVDLHIRDEAPDALNASSQLFDVHLPAGAQGQVRYRIRPGRRGPVRFGDLVVRARSGWGLVQRQQRVALGETVKVYPPFRGANDYLLLARIAERQEARRPRTLRGQGSDYESLRPYMAGDDTRRIDWKSSARRGQLISRNPQVERGQQLALMIDCGRMMAAPVEDRPRLEYALEAAVRLAYVVQKRGDALALAAFSNRIEALSPALRGPALMSGVLDTLAGVQLRRVESDYWQVTAQVLARLRRRSLIVLFTDVLDPAASQGLLVNLRRAASRHLVLCVVLADPALQAVLAHCPEDRSQAWEYAAACDLDRRRRLALESMRSSGILVLESRPEQLSHQLVRRYLQIRQADLQ